MGPKKKPSTEDQDDVADVKSPDPPQGQETQKQQEQVTQSPPVTMDAIEKIMQMLQEMKEQSMQQSMQVQKDIKQLKSFQHEQEARTNPIVRQDATKAANEHTAQVAQDPSTNRTPPAHVYVTSPPPRAEEPRPEAGISGVPERKHQDASSKEKASKENALSEAVHRLSTDEDVKAALMDKLEVNEPPAAVEDRKKRPSLCFNLVKDQDLQKAAAHMPYDPGGKARLDIQHIQQSQRQFRAPLIRDDEDTPPDDRTNEKEETDDARGGFVNQTDDEPEVTTKIPHHVQEPEVTTKKPHHIQAMVTYDDVTGQAPTPGEVTAPIKPSHNTQKTKPISSRSSSKKYDHPKFHLISNKTKLSSSSCHNNTLPSQCFLKAPVTRELQHLQGHSVATINTTDTGNTKHIALRDFRISDYGGDRENVPRIRVCWVPTRLNPADFFSKFQPAPDFQRLARWFVDFQDTQTPKTTDLGAAYSTTPSQYYIDRLGGHTFLTLTEHVLNKFTTDISFTEETPLNPI